MAKQIDLTVIDQMFSAVLSANESEATIKALRPQAEAAVQELMRQQGKPKTRFPSCVHHGMKGRYMTLEVFCARFRVVDPYEAAAQEPGKYYDAFVERD